MLNKTFTQVLNQARMEINHIKREQNILFPGDAIVVSLKGFPIFFTIDREQTLDAFIKVQNRQIRVNTGIFLDEDEDIKARIILFLDSCDHYLIKKVIDKWKEINRLQ